MTGQHVANQFKLIFSEYGWPEIWFLIMVHAIPCKPSPMLCSLTMSIILQVFHITHSPMVLQRNMSRLWKACSIKPKRKVRISTNCLIIYCSTHLTGIMKSPMQILQGRSARSDLPMSNAASKQLGIQPEVVRNNNKHAVLPTDDLHVCQDVMYQDSTSKHWYPAVIQSLCSESRSYKILTRDGIVYRKTQYHLKSFTPQNKNSPSLKFVSPSMAQSTNMWPLRQSELKKVFYSEQSCTSTDKQT